MTASKSPVPFPESSACRIIVLIEGFMRSPFNESMAVVVFPHKGLWPPDGIFTSRSQGPILIVLKFIE